MKDMFMQHVIHTVYCDSDDTKGKFCCFFSRLFLLFFTTWVLCPTFDLTDEVWEHFYNTSLEAKTKANVNITNPLNIHQSLQTNIFAQSLPTVLYCIVFLCHEVISSPNK